MPRMKIIVNPQSGRGHTRDLLDTLYEVIGRLAAEAAAGGRAYEVEWALTERPEHATELAVQAANEGFDIVVGVGGDGTIHEVVNGLMQIEPERRPLLGALPVGSGNDFARNLGITIDLEQAARLLFQGQTRRVDVCVVSDGEGRHKYWANTLGFGFSGAATLVARSSRSRLRGLIFYLLIVLKTIFVHHRWHRVEVQIDDAPPMQREVSMVNLCNGPAEGSGFPVVPHARMDDGLISFGLMRRVSRLQMLYFLPIVMAARHPRLRRFFTMGDAQHVRIEADSPLTVHLDGEIFALPTSGVRRLDVMILPAMLTVLCAS
ncbi:MAG: diacylglycerol kinase family lipid kinase [Anaerolineae bacterium]